MLHGFRNCILLAGCFAAASTLTYAQEVVHALAGTVTAVNVAAGTLSINTDDGSESSFNILKKPLSSIDFDRKIIEGATPASSFSKTNEHVILYFYGYDVALAVQDLGTGPLEKDSGTVVKFDKHKHLLTITTNAGVKQSFELSPKSVAETSVGAVEGYKFDPSDGDQVRVTATPGSGTETALFIRAS